MSFHEVQFPPNISYGSSGGPGWTDEVVSLVSGYERRSTSYSESLRIYNASVGIQDLDELYTVQEFMVLRHGRLFGFRWKDWLDYKSCPPLQIITDEDQLLGIGDGVTTVFQLVINQADLTALGTRVITKPVNGTVVVAVNGATKTEGGGADYTVDYTTGKITFNAAVAVDDEVTAGFEFDVPVRFAQTSIEINVEHFRAGMVPNVFLKEIKINPNA